MPGHPSANAFIGVKRPAASAQKPYKPSRFGRSPNRSSGIAANAFRSPALIPARLVPSGPRADSSGTIQYEDAPSVATPASSSGRTRRFE